MKTHRLIVWILFLCILIPGCGQMRTSGHQARLETIANNQEGHYTFQPHVFGSRYYEQFGDKTRDAFFAYCDALRNGDDTFACPDQDTLDWCVGRLSCYLFPVALQNIGAGTCQNGTAHIVYKTSKEAFLQKEKAFERDITDILNDCLSDDYNDFEKIIALYEYMTTTYTYDYEMYHHSLEWMDKQSPYRCLTEKKGICCEIAGLYNYLLLQVGIDSEEIAGFSHPSDDGSGEGHSWVFVTLDGASYHVDPTFGLTEVRPDFSYFMMTDQLREERDGFPKKDYSLAAKGDESRKFFDFEATSEKYAELWEGQYVGMDRSTQEIVYTDYDEVEHRFSYAE